jgi:large subunit ribosomal protein L21
MYAIIRAGGKQAKVQSGDVIEIERVKGDSDKLSFAPLLVVDDEGNAVSDRAVLSKATVTAKILGESQGPKIDIFKYKNKTGYRRRQGHRQKYTQIEITEIKLPGAKTKAAAKTTKASDDKPTGAKSSATKATAAKTAKKATESSEEE